MPTEAPLRLTVVLTHPVQYFAPWFRYIHAHEPGIALTVLYGTLPTPEQQGVGFGTAFEWDVPLLDGYHSIVMRRARPGDSIASDAAGFDPPGVGGAIEATRPDVVLVPGWHARLYRRALRECRQRGLPVVYRGDTNLQTVHRGIARAAWRWRTRKRLSQFDAYLSVGTRAREFLVSFGAHSDRIFDSPHAVDNAFFAAGAAPHRTPDGRREIRRRLGIDNDEFVVLFVGKLDENKRPLDAVRAAAAASMRLLVVGGGALDVAVQEEAERTGARVCRAGFLNQSHIAEAYAAADCLVLPSDRETWGLVVNEAMATGLPCVVSAECGCAPDLVDDETGATFPAGDVAALAHALQHVAARVRAGHPYAERCRERIAHFGLAEASAGLVKACHALGAAAGPAPWPRVVAWCGHFVVLGGMERIKIEIMRLIVERGGAVHSLVNRWDSERIRVALHSAGATWSTIHHRQRLSRRLQSPLATSRMLLDIAVSSAELLREVRRLRATHIVMPDFVAVLRCAPALALLRLKGAPVILTILANAPDHTPFYRGLWYLLIGPLTTRFVCNSQFTRAELLKTGVPGHKAEWIHNMPPLRRPTTTTDTPPPADVVYVGQLIPEKGVDVLIEAIALLGRQGHRVTLNVVGDLAGWVHPKYRGYREALVERARRPDLDGRVRFLGWREDVDRIMAAASIHCCPSLPELREAFGNVVAEAKLAGIPSVVSRSGGLPELVVHGNDGWLCDEVTPAALAEGLWHFLGSPDRLRAASRAARVSQPTYGRERFETRWAEVFTLPGPEAPAAPAPLPALDGRIDRTWDSE